jgi:hypothetical protein
MGVCITGNCGTEMTFKANGRVFSLKQKMKFEWNAPGADEIIFNRPTSQKLDSKDDWSAPAENWGVGTHIVTLFAKYNTKGANPIERKMQLTVEIIGDPKKASDSGGSTGTPAKDPRATYLRKSPPPESGGGSVQQGAKLPISSLKMQPLTRQSKAL